MISVIVPIFNEVGLVPELAVRLHALTLQGFEVIVVDGGSSDASATRLAQLGVEVIVAPAPGRARQMNLGASVAGGSILLFLHADTQLPPAAATLIANALSTGRHWGRFDVQIAGRSRWLPVIAWMMNWRSRLSGIATGDQALFVEAPTFRQLGGFPEQPLMEDIALSRRLLDAAGAPACLRGKVRTSGRRWDSQGVWRTVVLMWRLRFAYWRGVPAERLARHYQ